MERSVEIFDSTLRDGAQGEGISFSVEDKLAIVQKLDELGVTFIEAGNPGSNPKDLEFFRRVNETQRKHAQLVAFGSTRRKGIKAEDDGNIRALLAADTPVVAVFGKCWDLHVTQILGTTLEENLSMIEDTCSYLAGRGKRVFFDAEHFFDGYKENPEFAMEALRAAQKGGAACLALCDTNGGCFPDEIARITKAVAEAFPELTVSIHTHNDGGMAVANSIMAVEAGASQVQGTFLGFGERCGNANLSTVVANLQLKRGIRCIPEENLKLLTATARAIAEISNLMLRSARLDDETVHDYAESIYKEGKYLKSISSKLMDLILLRQKPEMTEIDVPRLVEEIDESVRPIASSRQVAFSAASVEAKLVCDRELIKSLLYNLIDNAVKASQPGTCVTLNAYFTQDGVMEFSVADQGSGIPKEELDKIFEPFYRVDKARSRKYGGAGLGLALCMEIAHAHAATLEIESEVGRGTVIRLRFDGKGKGSVL